MKGPISTITSLLQTDEQFREECRDYIGHPRKILEILKERGVSANEDDLRVALHSFDPNSTTAAEMAPNTERKLRHELSEVINQVITLRDGLQDALLGVVQQIDRGYKATMVMYVIAFALGVFMMLASISAAFFGSNRSAAILGGLGALDVITFLIFKPAQELQTSRSGLAQLQAAFFAWINDIYNWNRYLDAVTEEADQNNHPPQFERLRDISDIQMLNTERMVELVDHYTSVRSSQGLFGKHRQEKGKKRSSKGGSPPERRADKTPNDDQQS